METLESIPREMSILVVDDVPSARNIVVRFLKSLGFTNVTESARGSEAAVLLDEKSFELVISDLHLKDMMGIDLLKKTRIAQSNTNVPFIVITSDMSKQSFTEVMQQGASTYLLKPFNKAGLAQKLSEVLAKKA